MSEEPSIRALDEATIRQIAAGEVVERPASVAKELVENSLDADATRVSVAVENGGIDGVRVRDDGVGMTEAELDLAVREHTTSKISDIDDLESGVGTLGFRGEALHTIGAVSRLTVRSRPREGGASGDAGAELRVEGGDVGEVRPAGCPPGTVVEVEDLFFNTPARKKFLKTASTEFSHVNTVVTQYALANPDVAVSLEHDDREVFATEGRGNLESAVLSVYGREVAEAMREVEFEAEDGPLAGVAGLVSHPETTRSTREYLSTFVNGRYVTAGILREAVLDAYGEQLAPDRYPFAVLFLDVTPDAVDVNVHPRKTEVRFDDEAAVQSAVEGAVREALLDGGLIRRSAPRGRSAPEEASVRPENPDAEAVGGAGTPHEAASDVSAGRPRQSRSPTRVDASDDPADPESSPSTATGESATASPSEESVTEPEPPASTGGADEAQSGGTTASEPDTVERGDATAAADEATPGRQSTFEADDAAPTEARRRGGVRGPTTQRTLAGEAATPETAFDHLPRMRVLGQLHDTYVVAETPDGLVLVDQHAADERINYERLREALAGDTPTQALADPVELELTAREAALFEEYVDALAQVGFHAGRTGERTVEVRSVPAAFDAALDPALLRDALSEFASEAVDDGRRTVDAVADSLVADLACYPSVTGNTSLSEGSVVDLLEALDACENPYACPHGRPVLIEIDGDEVGDRFERDYPGHGGRRAE